MSKSLGDMSQALEAELQDLLAENETLQVHKPVTDKRIIKKVGAHADSVKNRFIEAGIPEQGLKALMRESSIQCLNQKAWKLTSVVIETKDIGVLDSHQIPAAHMQSQAEGGRVLFLVRLQ